MNPLNLMGEGHCLDKLWLFESLLPAGLESDLSRLLYICFRLPLLESPRVIAKVLHDSKGNHAFPPTSWCVQGFVKNVEER